MKNLIAQSGNKVYIGNISEIAKLIGVVPEAISRWILLNKTNNQNVHAKNGFIVYLDVENLHKK